MIKRYCKKGERLSRGRAIQRCVSFDFWRGWSVFSTDLSKPYMHIRECQTFGEMGLIEKELRNARASCFTDCLIVHIERVDFEANMRMPIH